VPRVEEPPPTSLLTARILCALAALLYPVWGLLFRWVDSDAIDPMGERLAVGAACAGLLASSFALPAVAARMQACMVALYWMLTAHYFSIVVRNDLEPAYAIGAIVVTASIAAAFSTRRALAYYGIGVTFAASVIAATAETTRDERAVFGAGLATTMLVAYVALGARLTIARSLAQEQARLRETFDALRQADRLASVGTLAAGVAHEINNPLTYVLGNLDLMADQVRAARAGKLVDDAFARELQQSIGLAHEGAIRVRDIVLDLKTFSRADDALVGSVDVKSVVESAVRLTHADVRHTARVVTGHLDVPHIVGSASKLVQVLVNLIINAAHAMPTSRPKDVNEIRIEARAHDGVVVVTVEDNGAGISPAHLSRIFDPFFTTKPVGKGTGLGLTVCHSIVTALGGTISADSEEGRGATFFLRLPVDAKASPRSAGLDAPPPAPAPALAPAPEPVPPLPVALPVATPAPTAPRPRILVIDDEVMIAEMIRRFLSKRGDVTVRTSAVTALEGIERGERFDAIVCDVMMPEVSGPDFLRELKVKAPEMARRTGFISGGVVTEHLRGIIDEGDTRFLAKPFGEKQLAAFVDVLMQGAA